MSVVRHSLVAVVAVALCTSAALSQKGRTATRVTDPFASKNQRATSGRSISPQAFAQSLRGVAAQAAFRSQAPAAARTAGTDLIAKAALLRLAQANGGPVDVKRDERTGVPYFIRGTSLTGSGLATPEKRTPSERVAYASRFLRENADLLRIAEPDNEFRQTEMSTDELGMTHIRYQQMYRGMEVWGQDVRVHMAPDGRIESFNGRYVPTPVSVDRQLVRVEEAQAVAAAHAIFPGTPGETSVRRVIDVDGDDDARVCWLVQTRGALDQNYMTFVDAESGAVRRSYNHVFYDGPVAGSGTDLLSANRTLQVYQIGSTFYMIDASKPMFQAGQSSFPQNGKGVIYTLDAKNADSTLYFVTSNSATSWSLSNAVSASANGGKVYDFYNGVLGRNAIDANGSTMSMVIRFRIGFNNAFWNGQMMVFGTGDGNAFGDLAGGMDVTAHEMTHGVVERTANLVYENQAGALNESFADVMGAMAEFWADPAKTDWWMIGEDVTTPSIAGDALRRLDQPDASNIAFNGQQPAHMDQYVNLPNTDQGDHGGVHTNSGIPNKAFYLFATSAGVTLDDATKIYYRALSQYLTRNAQFVDCRLAVIKAAEDLYGGPGNAKALAAAAAFDAVGIVDGASTPPPPSQPPVAGTSYLTVIERSSGLLYRTLANGSGITQLTTGPLWSRPAITDDGGYVFYVDNATNLHLIQSDATNDQPLSTGGGFNNVSVSPNGQYVAVTTTLGIPSIYVFDLVNGGDPTIFNLYTPTYTEGVNAGTILYPDRIDWASDGQILMYDAYNQVVNAGGDTTHYWDINLLRVSDGVIARLFPPQPVGTDIGNAVFASNTDNLIAFDYLAQGDSVRVLAVNLNTGDIGEVTNNWFSLGSPSFSADDNQIFYHYITAGSSSVFVVTLAGDGVTGTGDDHVILTGGIYPVSFTVGSRPTGVETAEAVPQTFGLRQNYPNPFNPSTMLVFDLEREGFTTLTIYDLLGRVVARPLASPMPAGTHEVSFDARALTSGVYIVRLESAGRQSSRRISLLR